jgi:hypothetical protein
MPIPQWESFEDLEKEHPGATTDIDTLNSLVANIYASARNASRREFRDKWMDFMTKQFLYAKGRDRRANQQDPKIQFISMIMDRAGRAFEDGKL